MKTSMERNVGVYVDRYQLALFPAMIPDLMLETFQLIGMARTWISGNIGDVLVLLSQGFVTQTGPRRLVVHRFKSSMERNVGVYVHRYQKPLIPAKVQNLMLESFHLVDMAHTLVS